MPTLRLLSLKDVNDLRAELKRAKTDKEKERIFEKYRKKGEKQSQALRELCRGKGNECHLNAIAELRNTNQAAATIVNNGLLLSLSESGRNDLSAWGLALDSNLPDLSYHEGQLSGGAKLLDTGVKLSPVVGAAATAGGSKAAQALASTKTPTSLANNRQPSVVDGEMTGSRSFLLLKEQSIHFTRDKHGKLTDGKYTVELETMKPHQYQYKAGKSIFYGQIDSEKAVLMAARYADQNNLWIGNKAKVPVATGNIGVLGNGTPTNYINIYRNNNGFIHGSPGSVK